MKLTYEREMHFRTGEYEHLKLSARVEIDSDELAEGEDPAVVAGEVLDAVMQPDIDRADESSKTPEDETYLHAWKDASN